MAALARGRTNVLAPGDCRRSALAGALYITPAVALFWTVILLLAF